MAVPLTCGMGMAVQLTIKLMMMGRYKLKNRFFLMNNLFWQLATIFSPRSDNNNVHYRTAKTGIFAYLLFGRITMFGVYNL